SPLTGFVGEADYRSILDTMHLSSGVAWTIPVTLSLNDESYKQVGNASAVALTADGSDEILAVVEVSEIFKRDREAESQSVYGTTDLEHPGVKAVHDAGDFCLAGRVKALTLPRHDDFIEYRLTPRQTRAEFQSRGWKSVVGFQTRNPIHRAHEYLQ